MKLPQSGDFILHPSAFILHYWRGGQQRPRLRARLRIHFLLQQPLQVTHEIYQAGRSCPAQVHDIEV